MNDIFLLKPAGIYFRPNDGCLWREDAPENTLKMTGLPTRVLTYILSSPGKVISKEELFDDIWESQGLQPSGTALTQYISLIRRNLAELGAEGDIIVTLPRAGFFISENNVECKTLLAEHTDVKVKYQEGNRHLFYYCASILFLMIVFIAIIFFPVPNADIPDVEFKESVSVKNCKVHFLSLRSQQFFTDKLDSVGTCNDDTELLAMADARALSSGDGRIFMAKCNTDADHYGEKLYGCFSYYKFQN